MQSEPRIARNSVWALPISLAATFGIDVSFSSSPYLDVSVQEVPPVYLCIQYTVTEVCSAGFPHSEIHGYSGYVLLTVAYRSLSRLSSALSAKASTLCSFLLDLTPFPAGTGTQFLAHSVALSDLPEVLLLLCFLVLDIFYLVTSQNPFRFFQLLRYFILYSVFNVLLTLASQWA